MNYSIIYLAIFLTSFVIATGCNVADANDEDTPVELAKI